MAFRRRACRGGVAERRAVIDGGGQCVEDELEVDVGADLAACHGALERGRAGRAGVEDLCEELLAELVAGEVGHERREDAALHGVAERVDECPDADDEVVAEVAAVRRCGDAKA